MVAYSIMNALRDLLHIKDILIVTLTPIVLLPFLLVDGGGQVSNVYIIRQHTYVLTDTNYFCLVFVTISFFVRQNLIFKTFQRSL